MASTVQVPVELYLHTAYEPDAEYVDGEVEERAVGEYDHSSWQYAIQKWFMQREEEWSIQVRPELRLQVSPTRYRVPDVMVLDIAQPREQIITRAPIAVFEILSPEDTMARILVKLGDYEAMGIRNILVIQPKDETVWQFQDGRLFRDRPESLAGSPCMLDWQTIISYLA